MCRTNDKEKKKKAVKHKLFPWRLVGEYQVVLAQSYVVVDVYSVEPVNILTHRVTSC